MTTSIITPQIASFAEAVRDALHDLPAEDRDDLTDGLEADLAEAYAEDLARDLPDPVEYATELRNAAGLPKGEPVSGGVLAAMVASVRRMETDLASAVGDNAALAPVMEFLAVIRPLWWVARAWLAAWLVSAFFGSQAGVLPNSILMAAVLIVFVVISVQWGRGSWRPSWLSPLIVIGNVAAVLLLLPVLAAVGPGDSVDSYGYDEDVASPEPVGLTSRGESVTNIFAYGADGKPLSGVQLFDQDGRPLVVQLDPLRDECFDEKCLADPDGMALAKATLETGAVVGNVFPLSLVAEGFDATPQPQPLPFIKVPAVLAPPVATEKVAPSNE